MKKLDTLIIKLEKARAIEAKKRQKSKEIEQDVAREACPFHINQMLIAPGGAYAKVTAIEYLEEYPHWFCMVRFDNFKISVFASANWKPAPTSEPPF